MIPFFLNHQVHQIHLIGIGGISMSGIAEILLKQGYYVTGSDIADSNIIQKLRNHGATIYGQHEAQNVHGADLVVYTAAVKPDNCERQEAERLNIPQIDRAHMLGLIMKLYEKPIAVSGSHGKTTTTSLLSLLMEHTQLDPTILVGGELDEIGGNYKIGNSQHFITEACEYVESFLQFRPYIGIILNIDEDHLDYYRDIHHIKQAFHQFARLVPKEGYLVVNRDDDNIQDILHDVDCHIITYGIHRESDFLATDITYNPQGYPSFQVLYQGNPLGVFTLAIPGIHNVYNALASIASGYLLGLSVEEMKLAIQIYKGIHRRFELLGERAGVKIIDDYAHHPTEIRATLEAAQKYPHRKIWCVFQPHTYTRTQALLKEFSTSFYSADHVIITDIYAAREKDEGRIHSRQLVAEIKNHPDARYISGFDQITAYLLDQMRPGDLLITMGAGDVFKIGKQILNTPVKGKVSVI